MTKAKLFYALLITAITGFIMYIVYTQTVSDPEASVFLGYKTAIHHPLDVAIWLPVMRIHALLACIAMISGAVNFASRIRRKYRKFHRLNGYVYLASVMIVGLTSGYMAPYATGGRAVSIAFNILTMLWPAFTVIAVIQIRKKQMNSHRKWMVRSYAFCFTNLSVHLLTFIIRSAAGSSYSASYSISVYITIPVLYILAEIVIRTAWRKRVSKDHVEEAS